MSSISEIVERIRRTPGCSVMEPTGQPSLPDGLQLPADLSEFYEQCGGALLHAQRTCAGHERILSPRELQRIDLAINGECFASGPFEWWYAVADVRDRDFIAIDFGLEHNGSCYDAFHETFAMPGYVGVIASSFTDLLTRLLDHDDDSTYWLQDDFDNLGEAFALYGYESIERPTQ